MNRHMTPIAIGLTLLAAGTAGADPVTTVVPRPVAGGYSTALLRADGTVQTWGFNVVGELGLGDTTNRLSPTAIEGLADVNSLSSGGSHMLAVDADGRVKAWGRNVEGQLGLGDTLDRASPTLITGLTEIKAVTGGDDHSLALKADGSVWAWGGNGYGQLGLGDTTNRLWPTQIAPADHVASSLTPAIVDFGTVGRGVDLTPESVGFQVTAGSMNLDFTKTALGIAKGPGFFTGYDAGTCVSGSISDSSGACQFDIGGKISGAT